MVKFLSICDYDFLRPKAAHFGRAHGLPKVHKHYDDIPQFRPIIDTTGTPHYNVGKFLAQLLNPLAQNEYTLCDSFHAVSEIKSIPKELFSEGYRLVSFDVVSLFTNVPLTKTVKIILDRVFKEKLITTTLSKRTLKKLILDYCTRLSEHTNPAKSSVGQHFHNCENLQHIVSLHFAFDRLYNNLTLTDLDVSTFISNLVINNSRILHTTNSRTSSNFLLLLEALYIKYHSPSLNSGLKASKELNLFS